ncbi:hypothetical protein [Faucicola atlantae]|uniref:Uncharacterized protein n=1 Tax=Faucicola atlantae TaxID=34059 RepID=A0A1B8QEY1_9GAMM|nr:hypothetical protein [Moraxella atlantae]OBX80527.1 hypothetical protein A9306_07460 [Moraxella atlantae]
MNRPIIEVFTSTMMKIPKPKLIQVLRCHYGDDKATTLYVGHDFDEAMSVLQNQTVNDMGICSLYFNEEVYARIDKIKQDFFPEFYPEIQSASKERFNELVHICFKERFEVQVKMVQAMYQNYKPYRSWSEKVRDFYQFHFKKPPQR